jgi:endonuclease/exonuclease/phosphatase family metal-dependent hydrolase
MTLSLLALAAALAAPPGVEIVGHRGASYDAPENTVAAVKLAWDQKADAAEFDVYLSKDGKVVVLHDKTLKRTAGIDKAVTDLTAEELGRLEVGRWKGDWFAGERLPMLEDVLATVPAGKRVFVEVKCGPEIVPELDRVLKASGLKPEQTAIISFSAEVVAAAKKARPDLKAYWIVSLAAKKDKPPPTAADLIAKAKEIQADGLDLSATPAVLTAEFARAVKAANLKLYVWTVNDVELARKMVAVGVEAITTDRPLWLRSRLADDPNDVRVMSFNVRFSTAKDGVNNWDNRKDFLGETVLAFDPDLLGTQETLADQRDFLAKKLPGHGGLSAGRDDGKEAGEMMAVYFRKDRFEKLDGGHFWLSETPDTVGSKSWDSSLPRMATWVKLKDKKAPAAAPIFYVNTHFDHRGPTARLESAKLMRAKIAELGKGCRVIVTGDFNSGEGSEPYKALFGGMSPVVDTYRVAHPTPTKEEGTATGFKASATTGARIDWIGCSKEWTVVSAAIDRTARDGRTPSDHFPVTAVLKPKAERVMLRVLSYNIHHGEGTDGKVDLPRIAKVIAACDPDFVAVQEVDHKTKRTGGVDQAAELARLTGLHGRFCKQIDYDGGEYGQFILSRFPISSPTVHNLPGQPNREQRIAGEVRATVGGREIAFVTTHLNHQSEDNRRQQAEKLNELFGTAAHPVILAGDLNANPDSQPLAILSKAWAVATSDKALLTYPSAKPAKQIDYVLVRPGDRFRVVETKVIEEAVASDHRPVLAVLEVGAP